MEAGGRCFGPVGGLGTNGGLLFTCRDFFGGSSKCGEEGGGPLNGGGGGGARGGDGGCFIGGAKDSGGLEGGRRGGVGPRKPTLGGPLGGKGREKNGMLGPRSSCRRKKVAPGSSWKMTWSPLPGWPNAPSLLWGMKPGNCNSDATTDSGCRSSTTNTTIKTETQNIPVQDNMECMYNRLFYSVTSFLQAFNFLVVIPQKVLINSILANTLTLLSLFCI